MLPLPRLILCMQMMQSQRSTLNLQWAEMCSSVCSQHRDMMNGSCDGICACRVQKFASANNIGIDDMCLHAILIITWTITAANDNGTGLHAGGLPDLCRLISVGGMAGARLRLPQRVYGGARGRTGLGQGGRDAGLAHGLVPQAVIPPHTQLALGPQHPLQQV